MTNYGINQKTELWPEEDAISAELVQLDCFTQDIPSVCNGKPENVTTANEIHTDSYLAEYGDALAKILLITGGNAARATNLIATQRNLRPDRNRLEAAKEIASRMELHLRAQKILAELGLTGEVDELNTTTIWLLRDENPIYDCIRLGTRMVEIGSGDRYHRDFQEELVPWDDLRRELATWMTRPGDEHYESLED